MSDGHIVVLGGSGFVGRHLVGQLAADGQRVVVPTHSRERARHLILLPTVDVLEVDIHDAPTLASLVRGAAAAVNLVGILNPSHRGDFSVAHVELTRKLVAACREQGVPRLLQMSALHADTNGPSKYLRSKGEAESIVADSGLQWTIFQPSVIFGPEDSFLNVFASLQRWLPVIALACADARFQPVFVDDVARAFVRSLGDDATVRQRYPLCGPTEYSLRQLMAYVGTLTGHRRPIVPLGPALSKVQASVLEWLPGQLLSRDNLLSMQKPSVCACAYPAVFGGVPTPLEAIAPEFLTPVSARSRYDRARANSGR